MTKQRLDVLLAERGLAESREQAQRLILAGEVLVAGQTVSKSGLRFEVDVEIAVRQAPRFVSRGGEKLEAAFERFGIDVSGLVCLDVGASTGGFTDCLLQHGAARVIAVDVGHGQLHWKLRQDPRVTAIEGLNARRLLPADIGVRPAFATVDVSFISLTKILPAAIGVLADDARLVTLIKPQFEAGREQVGRGGVVRDPAVREAVQERIRRFGVETLGLEWVGVCDSPILGPAGNQESLAYWRRRPGDRNRGGGDAAR
jgi:23S rRNA (cytidine1920-2'-O)/16S rRNA (cytidine1409-2'-O)-methyltransferase